MASTQTQQYLRQLEYQRALQSRRPSYTQDVYKKIMNLEVQKQLNYQRNLAQAKSNFSNLIVKLRSDNPNLIIEPDYDTLTIKNIYEKTPTSQITQTSERHDFGGQAVYAVEQPKTFVDKINAYLSSLRRKGSTNQFIGLAAGAATSVVGTGQAVGNLLFHPIKTVTNIPSGLKSAYERAQSGEYARILREEPGFATGVVATEILSSIAAGKIIKGGVKTYQKVSPPKYSTTFLSQQAGSLGDNLFFNTASTTTRKTPFSTRTFVSGSQSQLAPLLIDEDKYLIKSATRTATREAIRRFPTSKFKYAKPIGSYTADVTKVIPKEISIPLSRYVRKPLEEGFELQSIGKSRLLKTPKTIYYKSLSYGGNIEKNLLGIYGRYIDISKKTGLPIKYKTFNEFLGRIKMTPESAETTRILANSNLLSATKKVSVQKVALSLQTQAAERIIDNTIKAEIARKVNKVQKAVPSATLSSQLMNTPAQSIYYGTGQYEKTNEVVVPSPQFNSNARVNDMNNLLTSSANTLAQPSALKLSNLLISPSASAQRPTQIYAQPSAQANAQSSKQLQKQKQISKQVTPQRTKFAMFTPFVFRPRVPFVIPPQERRKRVIIKIEKKKKGKKGRYYQRRPTEGQLLFRGLPRSNKLTRNLTGFEFAR